MATIPQVRPGEIISSNFFNDLLTTITDLETRVAALETGGGGGGGTSAALITSFDPPNQVEVGQVLTMFGNFDFPLNTNAVTVDGVTINTIDFRAGSNNLNLRFIVPPPATVPPPGGRNVNIRIQNLKGTDQKSYRLLPATASTSPSPSITSVVNDADSSPTLRTGVKARINGTGFAANPADNIIKFRVTVGTITHEHPAPTIDVANSSTTQVVVTVPIITQIPTNNSSPAIISAAVGSSVPAETTVTVFRMP